MLLGLRDALRSGDVFVPGSRRYADPTSYLMTPEQWGSQRLEFCRLVEKSHDADQALAAVEDELHTALDDLEGALASGTGAVRLNEQGELVIPPLSAESIPEAAEALRIDLMEMLPPTQIASLLIEIDRRTHFSDHLTHAGGKMTRSPELLRNLYAVLIAQACNLGLTDHRLPMSQLWGTGTLSSSDGQRFPTRGKSITARALSRYFVEEGISSYTHVSDQHSTYGTKVIVVTDREAHYVLDEILGNLTDLPITEHATDTHGVTLVNFALFDLVGMQLSPRIRDLGKVTLYRTGTKAAFTSRYPKAGPLLTGKIDKALIARHWDDLLRLAASLKFGHVTASLIVGKLSASDRQNAVAAALKEYGALRCTIFAARYLTDEAYRRRITRQLNKGENLHALRRDIHFAHEGHVRHRYLEQQTEQALCLTLVTNAIVTWMTEYLGLAVGKLRAEGREVDDELLVHISPAHHENVILYGSYPIEVERELAELEQTSYRSLREPARGKRDTTAVNGRFSATG